MSYKIRPEDISDDAFDKMYHFWDGETALGKMFANILNAAIEAGLVSPPCYVVRDENGRLKADPFGNVRVAPGKPAMSCCEHWKGQTE